MDLGAFYQYRDGVLAPIVEPADQEVGLGVADSFLVEDGKVRSLEKHLARFTAGISKVAPEYLADLPSFFSQALALVPRLGRWWPRFELHQGAAKGEQLYLRLRQAPEQLRDAVLWTLPESDPRLNPAVKGPDLSLGMQLRRAAMMHGADEAVILDSEGFICEGALSSLVWWRGETLCAPNDETRWLTSITREVVFDLANQGGYQTRLEKVKPADLAGLEVWLLGALQGIRPVTQWIGLDAELGAPVHFESFIRRLRLMSSPIERLDS
jgi:branched-subunit amino acid aminotransferase/4-amino-4-deoxychorismate lyase